MLQNEPSIQWTIKPASGVMQTQNERKYYVLPWGLTGEQTICILYAFSCSLACDTRKGGFILKQKKALLCYLEEFIDKRNVNLGWTKNRNYQALITSPPGVKTKVHSVVNPLNSKHTSTCRQGHPPLPRQTVYLNFDFPGRWAQIGLWATESILCPRTWIYPLKQSLSSHSKFWIQATVPLF